jgi:hypothetical protein
VLYNGIFGVVRTGRIPTTAPNHEWCNEVLIRTDRQDQQLYSQKIRPFSTTPTSSWRGNFYLLAQLSFSLHHNALITQYFLIADHESILLKLYNGHMLIIMISTIYNSRKDHTLIKPLIPMFLKVDPILR